MISGGHSETVSPIRARTISPSSCAKPTQRAATPRLRVERLFRFLVSHQFDGADQTKAARMADEIVRSERLQSRLKRGALAATCAKIPSRA